MRFVKSAFTFGPPAVEATIAGGPGPVRSYIEELMPDILEERIHPGRVFDRITNLDGVPDPGGPAMDFSLIGMAAR